MNYWKKTIIDSKDLYKRILIYGILFFLFIKQCSIYYSMYEAGKFEYHDITFINDWFTNAIYHFKPFYITDTNFNHLTYNFTPSLILLVPFYVIFETQFILVILNLISIYVTIIFFI